MSAADDTDTIAASLPTPLTQQTPFAAMRNALSKAWALLSAHAGSLKLRVTLAALLALLVGIGSSVVVLTNRAQSDMWRERQAAEVNEAARTATLLSRRVAEQQHMLALAAGQLSPAIFGNGTRLRDFLDSQLVLRSKFGNLVAADRDGRVLWLTDSKGLKQISLNISDREYFRHVLERGTPTISGPITSRVDGELLVVLAQPLVADGQVFGMLAATIPLQSQDLLKGVTDRMEEDESVLVVVTNSQGLILAHPQRQLVGRPIEAEPRLVATFQQWLAEDAPVEPSGLYLPDARRVVGTAGVPGPDWMVWRSRNADVVLAPLAAGKAQALLWTALFALLMAGGLAAWLRWLLRPLSQLEQRATRLFEGALNGQSDWPETPGEVGRLQRVLQRAVAERARLEASNVEMLSRLQSAMAAAPVGIAFTRAQRFELVSAKFCRLFGLEEHELAGQSTLRIYASIDDFQTLRPLVKEAFAAGRPYVGEWEMQRADGHRFWARLSGQPVDPDNIGAGTIWTVIDVSAEVASRRALERAATHDPLTGLANRKAFEERLARVFSARPRSMPAALILFDLDRFKPINDSAGHAAGDAMLKAVAQAAAGVVRGGDLLVRLGGDEFAVVLERCPTEAALRVAEKLRQAIAGIVLPWEDHRLDVGASLGVAALSEAFATPEAWVAEADRACYAAKAAGRDAVSLA